jgi:hypothetical protein
MSSTARIQIDYRIAGVAIPAVIERMDETVSASQVPLPQGRAGTLSTRTSDSVGIATVASGHGITTSDTVAVFWVGGYRYGVAVSASDSTTISLGSGGAGDNLPAATTPIVVAKEVTVSFAIDGDDINVFAAHSSGRMSVNVRDDANAAVFTKDVAASESCGYISNYTGANPFASESLGSIVLANGDSSQARTGTILLLKNSI